MIHGLLLAAAIDAAEPTDADVEVRTRQDSFGRAGSVVLGEVIAARYGNGPAGLGVMGSPVATGWFSFGSVKTGDMTYKSIQVEPSFDVFVANGLSLGATVGGGVGSYELASGAPGGDTWYVTAVPRIGETITLSRDIAVWIRAGAGVALGDGTGYQRTGIGFRATFEVPFVFTITKHIALQAGPRLVYFNQLAGPPDGHGFVGGASAGLSIVL